MTPETRVPDGETPARCPHCDRPFRRERERDLHVGEDHAGDATEAEVAAAEEAAAAETDELFVFHMKVVAAIALIYAGFVIVYMVLAG